MGITQRFFTFGKKNYAVDPRSQYRPMAMAICMMTSFDDDVMMNPLRQAIVFGIFSFVKNHSCVTRLY